MLRKTKEDVLLKKKQYYQKNKEIIKEKQRARNKGEVYLAKERLRGKKRRLNPKHVDRINLTSRKHYLKNIEKYKIKYELNSKNPEFKSNKKLISIAYNSKPEIKLKKKIKQNEYIKLPKVKSKLLLKSRTKEYKDYQTEYRKSDKRRVKDALIRRTEKYKEKKRIYYNNRMKNDVNFKLLSLIRSRINYALKGNSKSNKLISLLGCSSQYCKKHLESKFNQGMSWENWSFNGWHIDHIIPCDAFDLSLNEAKLMCFNYTNLQPLWGVENLKKNGSVDYDVLVMLNEKGLINPKHKEKLKMVA